MKLKLLYSFILSTLLAVFSSAIIPSFKPVFYAPFLVICFLNSSFTTSLWLACLGGVFVDIFSSTHMGLNALIYTTLSATFYRQKRYFKDTPANIALFTVLLSFLYTLLSVIFLFILDKGVKLSFFSILTDFVVLPVFDGLYSLVFFALPLKAFEVLSKRKLTQESED